MPVKIRLTRFGRTKQAFYNIVVAHDRTANRKRPLEVLGTYDPTPRRGPYEMNNRDPALGPPKAHKDIMLDMTRTKYWIGCGVQPTPAAWKILAKVGILEPKERPLPRKPLGPIPFPFPAGGLFKKRDQ